VLAILRVTDKELELATTVGSVEARAGSFPERVISVEVTLKPEILTPERPEALIISAALASINLALTSAKVLSKAAEKSGTKVNLWVNLAVTLVVVLVVLEVFVVVVVVVGVVVCNYLLALLHISPNSS